MQFRNSLITVGLITLITCSFVFFGCSSDNDTGPTVTKPNASQDFLEMVSAQVSEHLDSTVSRFWAGLSIATAQDRDTVSYALFGPTLPDSTEESTDWNVWFLTNLEAGANMVLTVTIDSLMYSANGTSQAPGPGADQLIFKHHYIVTNTDSTVTNADLDLHSSITFSNIDSTVATANGTVSMVIDSKFVSADSTVWNDWDIQASVTDMRVARVGNQWDSGCPISGTASVVLTHTHQIDSDAATTYVWTYTTTFTNGAATATVTNDAYLTASYSDNICTP
ncbi:MAG: hypothetical protein DRP45_10165 [Candidatus Zixiibacteriota bacterium]|nr:MAG: hypothetical protein DRP45_10165 [candidate division Zixibacteria bacterium]